jgi:hypothetical protein
MIVKVAAVGVRPPQRESLITERGSMLELVIHHVQREIDQALPWKPDLILLPECCDRPLDLAPGDVARWDRESAPGVLEHLAGVARSKGCVVVYGAGEDELLVIERDGSLAGRYRRRATPDAPFVTSSLGKLALALSADLQDHDLLGIAAAGHPDLVLAASRFPGGMLEQYWAFSCRAHLASAVLFRSDLRLPCRILSPVGSVLAQSTTAQTHARHAVNLNSAVVHLDGIRQKLLDLQGSMGDQVVITDPDHLGSAHIACTAPGVSVKDLLRRFSIETVDEYFGRYLAAREESLGASAAARSPG